MASYNDYDFHSSMSGYYKRERDDESLKTRSPSLDDRGHRDEGALSSDREKRRLYEKLRYQDRNIDSLKCMVESSINASTEKFNALYVKNTELEGRLLVLETENTILNQKVELMKANDTILKEHYPIPDEKINPFINNLEDVLCL